MISNSDPSIHTKTLSGLYDGLLSDGVLPSEQARDLRALARVFDVEAGPDISLKDVWRGLRPLLPRSWRRSDTVEQSQGRQS